MLFSTGPSVEILTVCTANICRSPMAEGVLREELKQRGLQRRVGLDSAGTHVITPGLPPDGRALRVCAREGINIRKSRSRQVIAEDFHRFQYLLAMDERNFNWLQQACPDNYRGRIARLGSWVGSGRNDDIPDPYFGSLAGFEDVLMQLHRCLNGFLAHLVHQLDTERG